MCAHRFAFRAFAAFCFTILVLTAPAYAQGPGGPAGADIQIRAENKVTTDVPFCSIGGGAIGDKLRVDAFMDMNGVVTGRAIFEPAGGPPVIIELDRAFSFFGGNLVQNQANQNTVAIWINDFAVNPAHVNVELPRGCGNTKSTFTPGLDKVTMQIKFR